MKINEKCPLCGLNLTQISLGSVECRQMVMLPTTGEVISQCHYKYDDVLYIVYMIVLPYKIISRPGKSKILKLKEEGDGWKTITVVPFIHPDTEEKLLERVKRLVLLS